MSRIILITGASSGFGRDTAETLAAAGHTVFASMREMRGRNREAAGALRDQNIETLDLDVTVDASVDDAVATLLAKTGGRLDVVINNAGLASAGVSESFTPAQVRALFEVNVFGIQRVLRATLPTLRRQGEGLVINVGSILGRVTFPFFGLYGASKYALEGLTDSYRYELSQLGVDVVLLQPSAYPTRLYASVQQPADGPRANAYGEIGAIPGRMFESFMGLFQSADAPRPHDVAEAISTLIATPGGRRPERVVVGKPFGSDAANAALAPIQRQVVEGLGLGGLATLKG
ncbi:MAG: SDR family oxidoreductase [Rhodocyclaceae bacterium]|nr:SDR family oxidoreductase [Rhodocyclaceae bacterium]